MDRTAESVITPGRVAFVVIAVVVFIIDRLTKGLVNAEIGFGQEVSAVPGLVWLTNTRNSGAAFGLAQSGGTLFLLASVLVSAGIVIYVFRNQMTAAACVFAGLILGGTAGNGYDRLFHGWVTDFIALHWWPVFNVADSAITVGVVLLLAGYGLRRRPAA